MSLSGKRTESEPQPVAWETIRDRFLGVPRHVVERRFASETVLLNVETGYYYGMDEIGARFFEVLRAKRSPAAALPVLTAEFEEAGDRIREDLARFCVELVGLGLLEWQDPDL